METAYVSVSKGMAVTKQKRTQWFTWQKKYIMNSIVDYKALVIFIYMSVLSSSACAEDYDEVFPTGTVWEEVYAEPGEPQFP